MIEEALKVRAAFKLRETFKKLNTSTASENVKQNSQFQIDIVRMSYSHLDYIIFMSFQKRINSLEDGCLGVKKNLQILCMLFGLDSLCKDSASLYETGYFSSGMSTLVDQAIQKLMEDLRP